MKNLFPIFIGLSIVLFFSSCEEKNDKIIDVSHIEVDINLERYDQTFFEADTLDLENSLETIRAKDSVFFDFFTIQAMRFGRLGDTTLPNYEMMDPIQAELLMQSNESPVLAGYRDFFTNPYVLGLYDTVQTTFDTVALGNFEEELEEAFKHYQYYFPEKEVPQVYTMISEFSYNAITYDSTCLVFGLDLYLGADYMYYGSFDFPGYVVQRFETEFMVPNGMEALYNRDFAPDMLAETDALLYAMIENGKKLYFLECMTPKKEEHYLIGYTAEQLAWCELEEGEIWKFYNENDLFYSKDFMDHRRHVGDGPLTAGMPAGAPGNVGSWIGWQIVNSYMKNGGNISLQTLLETDAETIMNKSQYKPK